MFDTKIEVDRHVESCLKKLNNETERSLKCLAFARLYFKVGEYEQARRYASAYLTVKPLSAEALSLLGKTLEKQEKHEAAIEAYRKSLDIDPKQNQLVIKVCELLSSDNVNIDLTGARYFCERAQSLEPHNPVVFCLKERLVAVESQDPSDVTQLLLTELRTRPSDVQLRVRLLSHYLQHNQIREAYLHASEFQKENYVCNSLVWYETVAEVLVRYQRENATSTNLTWEFWMLLVSVLDKLAALTLDERTSSTKSAECLSVIFNLDQTLTVAAKNVTGCNERPLLQEFLNHYRAQLCFHFMGLLFKQAKRDLLTYKEAMQMALPLLFISYHAQPPELDSMWLERCPEARRKQVQRWHKEAAFRCSQSGHILLAVAKDRKMAVVEKAMQSCSGLWREHLFKKLFVTREQQSKLKSSYFVACPGLVDVTVQLPEANDVVAFDQVAQKVFPESMHHLVWICLTQKLPTFKCTVFEGLPYSVKHLNNCSAESLSVLDVEAFLYCVTLTVQQQLDDAKQQAYYNNDKPNLLPAAVTSQMGTQNQTKWYTAAHKMYLHEYSSDMSELRLNLIRGLEVVRCVGNHGLDVKLLVILATTFAERAKHLTKQSEVEANEARAELYWKAALPVLEKMQKNQAVTYANNRLFEFKAKEMSPAEVAAWIDEGKLFSATLLMKKKEHERALQIFEGLKSPYASFYQSQIYKAMADEQVNQNKENVTSEMRSQHIILLSKARDCLYLTLDRLRDPSTDRKHPLNQQLGSEIEKIERLLSRIDPDIYNHRNECDGMSDENVSSAGSVDHLNNIYSSTFTNSFYHDSLTPQFDRTINSTRYRLELPHRREARPSPERLDAQLRQMQASRDATINHILEQNRIMLDSHRNLVDELRGFKDVVSNLASTVEELKQQSVRDEMQNIKKCVTDLKNAFEELKNFQDVKDVVHEMKKELSEMKKDNKSKTNQNQLSEEDLYVLDEEYGTDYGLNSNVAAFNPSLYPRLPSANSLTYPPALYPGLYPMYPYTGLGLPQANLPFGQETQIPDFRALHTLSQLPQTSYTQATLTQPKPWEVVQPSIPQSLVQPLPAAQPVTTTSSVNKSAPVNVVITSSDPLPKTSIQTTQVLSVTIPPQHLKGNIAKSKPHNYQIPLPTNTVTTPAPAIISQPPLIVSTQGLLSNVAPPVYSAIDKSPKNAGLGLQIEKSLALSFSADKAESPNKSNISSTSVEEHDPCPDFKPIIPLPDEVPVNTGEENEKALFCERAKLFRFTNKEWKERGIGNIKILQSRETGKIRILMRRDQVHKICANHLLTKDMALTPMPNNSRAYIWAAHDYADEEMVVEKFCVRFKTEEEANDFRAAFKKAKDELKAAEASPKVETPKVATPTAAEITTTMGGFKFTSTPTFKPKESTPPPKVVTQPEPIKTSPFASFSFTPKSEAKPPSFQFGAKPFSTPEFKPLQLDAQKSPKTPEDFEPSVEFAPVVPLPELIDVKTGEENAEILFEGRAKLLRYDSANKEWKERGVGIMKLLKESVIRLVMRREQVLKVCCNHQLLKSMQFSKMTNSPKALTWYAQDFSEGVLKAEMFAIRFKLEEQADAFFKAVTSAQELLDENSTVKSDKMVTIPEIKADVQDDKKKEDKKVKSEPEAPKETTPKGWGDKFKPKLGSWECKNCYIVNEPKNHHCIACETPKSSVSPKKDVSASNLSFGTSPTSPTTFSFGRPITTTSAVTITPIPAPEAKKDISTFSSTPTTATSSWGDAFKPKQGSWECKMCLVRNDADKQYCASCESPKDDTVPKKEPKGFDLDTPGLQFNFGIPTSKAPTTGFSFARTTSTFTFGSTSVTTTEASPKPFTFTEAGTKPFTFTLKGDGDSPKTEDREFVFGSPQKHSFEFTSRSPRRHSGCQGDEESDSFVEDEGDHIYFKPVIPLPDKVEVKTGEEQEQVLYCHRAKLFRFVQGEWKERGLGDIKILLNSDSNKLRVVMRRDQVLKICLNHALTAEIEYLPKDEKTWLFSAPDFSEGEINRWQFCIRFKNAEIAQKFKKAVDDALAKIADDSKLPEPAAPEETSDEVEFVSETQVTPEEEQEAIRLMLPAKFMAYRQLPDCACETCKKDDELLAELFQKKPSVFGLGTPCKPSAFDSSNSGGFIFGTPLKNFSFGSTTATPSTPVTLAKSESLKDMLMKPSVLSDIANKEKEAKTAQDVGKTLAEIKPDVKVKTEPKTAAKDAMKNFTFTLSPAPQTPTESAYSQAKPSIFASTTVSSVFSGTTTPTGSLFDSSTKTSTFGSFGSTSVSMGNIFSTPSTFSPGSIFGTPATVTSSEMKPLFGSTAPLFGSVTNTATFADLAAKGAKSAPTFADLAANTPTTPTFADLAANPEQTKTVPSFGNLATKNESAKPEAKQDELVLKCDSNLSFSSLAAASPNVEAFKTSEDDGKPFAFLGSGTPVFASLGKTPPGQKKKDKSKDEAEASEGEAEGEEYDPHYEPIVPLPDAIVVSTGEEEEEQRFNERAKLFRYDNDNKEWKERGIGQMKILYHPKNGTYRFLLRREQVHKLVLNMLITPALELQPMSTSDKAWLWYGYNHSDEEAAPEKLAIRFKNCELAQKFRQAVQETVAALKEQQEKHLPASIQNFGVEDISSEQEASQAEEEDDDEDDRTVMFMKPCALSEQLPSGEWTDAGSGELQVYYDPDIYGSRISVCDDTGLILSNTLIGINTEMTVHDDHTCTWKAVDWAEDAPRWRMLKASFEEQQAAEEFHCHYLESLQFAHESDLVDGILAEQPDTDDD